MVYLWNKKIFHEISKCVSKIPVSIYELPISASQGNAIWKVFSLLADNGRDCMLAEMHIANFPLKQLNEDMVDKNERQE